MHLFIFNLEIYIKNKSSLDHFLGTFLWAPIAVDHYHFGSGYNTDVYLYAKYQSQFVKEILTTKEYSNLIGQEHSQTCPGMNAPNK